MVKVYDVVKTQDVCEDYEVYVNGKRAELNTARVSAYPFNRRWPGHQRQIEQTELINFLSMEADEEVLLEIRPKTPSLSVRIRPRDLNAETTVSADGTIKMKVKEAAQFTVEPYGKSRALHVFIDPPANYGVDFEDENVLYFGAGEHDVGDLYLKSGQTLFIDEGAVVYATIFALHVENVKILGRGILDNSKNKEKILYEANVSGSIAAVQNATRENTLNFLCCKNVEIDGITIRDSLVYNIDCMSSENVRVNNIKVIGCWRFNSDGVHFSNCTDASLTNSFLRTYDDSICVRGFANYEYARFLNDEKQEDLSFECKNITINNCVVWNDWGKNLQIGTETLSNEIKNVTFENCKLIHTTGMALTMWVVDNAFVHDVTFKNIAVEYDEYMLKGAIQNSDSDVYTDSYDTNYAGFLVNFRLSWYFEYSMVKTAEELGRISGVKIEDLRLYAVQKPKFGFYGASKTSKCENIELKDVYWNDEKISVEFFERQCEKNEFAENIELK